MAGKRDSVRGIAGSGAGNAHVRPLTIFAQDPGVKMLTTQILVPAESLIDGPWGFRVQVTDYDAAARKFYRPRPGSDYFDARRGYVDPYRKIADASPEKLLDDPRFHAQNVYAIVMRILARFEFALGRRVRWSFPTHQLKVAPHAFSDANAFYSENDEALLFGYFPGRSGKTIFACLSHDIVAHETTHALIDGLRTHFTAPSQADQAAFHEGFADVVALLSVLALPAIVDAVLEIGNASQIENVGARRLIKADALSIPALQKSVLLGLAEQMGEELSLIRGKPLRNSTELAPRRDCLRDPEFSEPHRRGEVLVAAVMWSYLNVLKARLDSLDGGKSGWLDRDRVVEECAKSADHLLTMSIRALDYCPPVHITFRDFLSALLTADAETCPDDSQYHYRARLAESFAAYGIDPAVNTDKQGMWQRCDLQMTYASNHYRPMQSDPEEVFRFIWENRAALEVTDKVYTQVVSVRPCVRVAPDGVSIQETIVEYRQVARLRADELKRFDIKLPRGMPADAPIDLSGGGTLVFDEFGTLKFKVTNRIDSATLQAERIAYLWEIGAIGRGPSAFRFSELHRLRSLDRRFRPQERWL